MISVTAAAHTFKRAVQSHRPISSQFKAFGSGRIALSAEEINQPPPSLEPVVSDLTSLFGHRTVVDWADGDGDAPSVYTMWRMIYTIRRLLIKVRAALIRLLLLLSFTFNVSYGLKAEGRTRSGANGAKATNASKRRVKAPIHKLEDRHLLQVFQWLDVKGLMRAKRACRRWSTLIGEHAQELPTLTTDQIKLYFDEGEVLVYPLDERKVPIRFVMPPAQHLEDTLRHISTQSLFIRGLIPIETTPVLKRLLHLDMHLSQIYFLWCDFDPSYGAELLAHFFKSNQPTLSDIGFEACTPHSLISDQLLKPNLPQLTSLRLWKEKGAIYDGDGQYGLSDSTLLAMADLMETSDSRLETIDLSDARITVSGVARLIEAWWRRAAGDLSFSLHNCRIQRADIINSCNASGIPMRSRGMQLTNGYRLSLHVT